MPSDRHAHELPRHVPLRAALERGPVAQSAAAEHPMPAQREGKLVIPIPKTLHELVAFLVIVVVASIVLPLVCLLVAHLIEKVYNKLLGE